MCDSETTGCFFRSSKKVSQASKTEYKCLFSTWATEYKVCLLFYYFQTANINQKITLCLLILEQTHKKKIKTLWCPLTIPLPHSKARHLSKRSNNVMINGPLHFNMNETLREWDTLNSHVLHSNTSTEWYIYIYL